MAKLVFVFMVMALASVAHAAESIGTLKSVSGIISISSKNAMSRAVEGTSVDDGSAILVASDAQATLVLASGCSVPLTASQYLVVDSTLPCNQLQASVKQLFPAYRVAQAGGTLPPAVGGGNRPGETPARPGPASPTRTTGSGLWGAAGAIGLGIAAIASGSGGTPPVSPQ